MSAWNTLGRYALGLAGQIAGIIGGGINAALKITNNLMWGGFKMAVDFEHHAVAFSRQIGLSEEQAIAYTTVLIQRTHDLAMKYGIAAEEIEKIERGLAHATGRAMILSQTDFESAARLQKLVGDQAYNNMAEQLHSMGGQIGTINGAVSKAYATALRQGLDSARYSEKFAKNLSMMNKFSMRKGVEDIAKMTALSEKLGINMEQVEGAANKFIDVSDAIENSAKLSMLGGAMGAFGGNPLDMMYEANADPASFMERYTKMIGGRARFDARTGLSTIDPASMDFIRAFAQALGLNTEDVVKGAKKQAEVKYKEGQMGWLQDSAFNDIRDKVLNKSYVENGRVWYTDINNKKHDITNGINDENVLKELRTFSNMSDNQIELEQAQLMSLREIASAVNTVAMANIASSFTRDIESLKTFIKESGMTWAESITKAMGKYTHEIIIALAGISLSKGLFSGGGLGGFFGRGAAGGGGGGGASGALRGLRNFGSRIGNALGSNFRNIGNYLKWSGRQLWYGKSLPKSMGKVASPLNWVNKNGTIQAFTKGGGSTLLSRNATTSLLKGAKSLKITGIGAIVGLGSKLATDWYMGEGQERDRKLGSIGHTVGNMTTGIAGGASIGAMIGGPWGAVFGGAAGAAKGYWDTFREWQERTGGSFMDFLKMQTNNVSDWFKIQTNRVFSDLKPVWNGIKTFFGQVGDAFGKLFKGEWIKDIYNWGKEKLGFAEGGVVPGTSYTGDKLSVGVNSGEGILPKARWEEFNERLSALPYGGTPTYIFKPRSSEFSSNGNKITVDDIKVNISGTIRLEGGGNHKDIDINQLLNNNVFVSKLADIINDKINSNINLKSMHDTSYLVGRGVSSSTVGKMMTSTV